MSSLLTRGNGKSARRAAPLAAREAPRARPAPQDTAALNALERTVARLEASLAAAQAEAAAARAESLTHRTRADELSQSLASRNLELEQARGQLAATQAGITGITGQLETERAARAAVGPALEQAIAAATRPAPPPPAPVPPTAYEMQVVDRDVNSRVHRVRFVPLAEGGT